MSKKFFAAMTGAIALALGVGLNTQNALNDYGISENPLSKFVWAQTNTDGDGDDTDDKTKDEDGTNTYNGYKEPKPKDCVFSITGDATFSGTLFGLNVTSVKGDAGVTITIHEAQIFCEYGGNNECDNQYCSRLWIELSKNLH